MGHGGRGAYRAVKGDWGGGGGGSARGIKAGSCMWLFSFLIGIITCTGMEVGLCAACVVGYWI